jgi:hypothetical protein
MDVLYISPEFPPNYAHFIRHLHELGVRVWAIGEAEFFSMPADLRAGIRWYARCDLKNFRRTERSIGELLEAKHALGFEGAFDVVESHNEQWLRLEAFINERYAIPGITRADVDRLKKKTSMKRVFKAAGLRPARGALVVDSDQAAALAAELGYPVILKPDEGVGAGDTHRVEGETALRALVDGLRDDTLLEEFIAAPIVTYDGLTDRDGAVVFESSLAYGEGLIEYVGGKDTFFHTRREIPGKLAAIGQDLARRFDIRRKFFHFEFFSVDEEYLPIEINSRPPGGAILDVMNYSADTDLYRAWACVVAGRPPALPEPGLKKYFVGYVGRKEKPYALGHAEVLARYGHRLVEHGENPPLFWQVMGKHRYIFRAENEEEIRSIADGLRQTEAAP